MIRLDEKQYRAVKKMTRAACANNDCGNCLLLDDGETCVCVQSISYSLLCRYFREAVLPADRQLCEQITRSGETDLKRCAVCGAYLSGGYGGGVPAGGLRGCSEGSGALHYRF